MTQFSPIRNETPLDVGSGTPVSVPREVAREVAVALTFNGVAHVVMFMTPQDVEDFVVGFALSEGIIARPVDILSLEISETDQGLLAAAQVSKENFENVLARRRNLPGQSGCGICGIIELEAALRPLPKIENPLQVPEAVIFKALGDLHSRQPLNQATHAVHGAAFVAPSGDILAVREDIGRHNALDKLVGHLARAGLNPSDGLLLMTSRCSVELVQKAVIAGFPQMVTISAPTTLALDLARASGLSLICVAREDGMLVYHDACKDDEVGEA